MRITSIRKARLRKAFAVLAIAPLVALSACGGSDQAVGFTSTGGVLAAVTSTTAEKTSKVDISVTMSGIEGAPGEININGTGAFDYESGNGIITANIPELADGGIGGTVETRFVDGDLYVKTTLTEGQPATPTPWIKVDVEAVAQSSGLGSDTLGESTDPTEGLEMLANATSGEITEVGTETLRGDETTHYRTNLDLTKVLETSDEATKQQMERLAGLYGNTPIPTDVWVDGNDRVRKLTFTIDLANLTVPGSTPGSVPSGTIALGYEFYDFGTEVDVVAPPAEEVTDLTAQATEQLNEAAPAA